MRGVTADKLSVEFVHSFQLTRLMRGVTNGRQHKAVALSFQLTRLMRGVTEEYGSARWGTEISTHTPHARRD